MMMKSNEVRIEIREVTEEEVAEAFGITVAELQYREENGIPLGGPKYQLSLWDRLLSLFLRLFLR